MKSNRKLNILDQNQIASIKGGKNSKLLKVGKRSMNAEMLLAEKGKLVCPPPEPIER